MLIIDGKKIAAGILNRLKREVDVLPLRPVFCDVLVGDDPVSASYVRIKAKTAERVGIEFRGAVFPKNISAQDLVGAIKKIALEPRLCGLIVQLPLPPGLPRQEILDAVDPVLDVDCIGSASAARFYAEDDGLVPPTVAAIMEALGQVPGGLKGKRIAVVGQGELVGKPVASLLRRKSLEVVVVDKSTADISGILKKSDIIISATGQPGLITGSMIKPGAAVFDAGTAESEGGIVGDVDFDSVAPLASVVSPVPGGIGPVTVAMLLKNVVKVARQKFFN